MFDDNEEEENDEFSINNPKWREEEGLFDDVLVLEDGFEICRYDVMLGVEKMTPFIRAKYGRLPNIKDIFIFACMLYGE
jgi:hypothetical protein